MGGKGIGVFVAALAIAVSMGVAPQQSGLPGGLQSLFKLENAPEPTLSTVRFAPLSWSPVRRELAFGGTLGGADGVVPPAWLLPSKATPAPEAVRHAIWLVPSGESSAEVVAVTDGAFSAPTWAPDGDSIYYIHWEPLTNGEGALALVRRHRDGKLETIVRETGRFPFGERRLLPFETLSASPDGLFVAAPWLGPKGLVVVDLDKRRIARRLQQASAPAWSADGKSLAYFVFETPTPSVAFAAAPKQSKQRNGAQLMVAPRDALLASPSATPAGKPMGLFDGTQPVQWDLTGHTLLAQRSIYEPPSSYVPPKVHLFRIGVAEARLAKVFDAQTTELKSKGLFASFAYDLRADSLYLCMPRSDGRVLVDRLELSGTNGEPPWHPFDDVDAHMPAPLGALALSLDGKRLAFRFGRSELGAPVAVRDLERDRTMLVATDDAGDLRALAVFAASVRRSLLRVQADNAIAFQMTKPGAWESGRELAQRLNVFPRRQQFRAIDDPRSTMPESRLLTVRRLAADGLALLAGRDKRRTAPRTQADVAFDEFALQFHYLREEFDDARRCIERLSADAAPPIERSVMLGVLRAQCLEATAGSGFARLALESLVVGGEYQALSIREDENSIQLTKRIEELRTGPTLIETRDDDEP